MKIDIFTHVVPPRYKKALYKYLDRFGTEKNFMERRITLTDHEERMRVLSGYEDVVQVLSTSLPPLEEIVNPKEAAELAKISNDEMAEWVAKDPKKYLAAIANLPLNDVDASLREAERAIKELGFKGIQIFTSVQGKPLSSEEFMPLYKIMSDFDLPIWIHPLRRSSTPDYSTENSSFHQIFSVFGWPYETTLAMTRLVFGGIFEKFPTLKFITHHLGGMIPYYADRIVVHYNNGLERLGQEFFPGLKKHPIEYFRMFYNDTALNGNASGLKCGYDFFGEDRLLFGSDMPYDVENGAVAIRQTIEAIEAMNLPESSKRKIYEGNARRLLHL
jgi:predicted TIM-barrel fold metal-dependent hydrolase